MSEQTFQPVTPRDWAVRGIAKDYVTVCEIGLWVGHGRERTLHRIPAGFDFDVSIPVTPWALRPLLKAVPDRLLLDRHDPRYRLAAAWHDWFLIKGYDRWFAAAVFRAVLEQHSVSTPRRASMATATIAWPWAKQIFKR